MDKTPRDGRPHLRSRRLRLLSADRRGDAHDADVDGAHEIGVVGQEHDLAAVGAQHDEARLAGVEDALGRHELGMRRH